MVSPSIRNRYRYFLSILNKNSINKPNKHKTFITLSQTNSKINNNKVIKLKGKAHIHIYITNPN